MKGANRHGRRRERASPPRPSVRRERASTRRRRHRTRLQRLWSQPVPVPSSPDWQGTPAGRSPRRARAAARSVAGTTPSRLASEWTISSSCSCTQLSRDRQRRQQQTSARSSRRRRRAGREPPGPARGPGGCQGVGLRARTSRSSSGKRAPPDRALGRQNTRDCTRYDLTTRDDYTFTRLSEQAVVKAAVQRRPSPRVGLGFCRSRPNRYSI
jgi:hypothetical protein